MVSGLKRPLPYSAPINPPMSTVIAHQGSPGAMRIPFESKPAMPDSELTRINAAATPEMTRSGAQRISSMSGLRNTPPPTPVRPDRKPNPAPQTMSTGQDTALISYLGLFFDVANARKGA